MKITDVKLFLINQPYPFDWGPGNAGNHAIVKIETDDGLHGIGEAFHSLEDIIEGCVQKFRRWLLGQDPTRVIHNWNAIYRGMRYPLGTGELSALSAIEQALWDIAGKACGLPIYKMLGGPVRERIKVYASGGTHSRWPEMQGKPLHEQAKVLVEKGWTGMKFGPQAVDVAFDPPSVVWRVIEKSPMREYEESVERVRLVREAVGPDFNICLDFHGKSFSPADAIRLAKGIEPYHPYFLEEPALTENPDQLVEVKAQTSIPIAGGERVVHRDLFKDVIDKRAVDIIQLEPTACGGILETVRRSAVAELSNIVLAPHHACSPVGLCACAHIDAAVPNFLIQEVNNDVTSDFNRELFSPLPKIENGYLELPEGPGLGIDLNEEAAAAYPPKDWDRPVIIKPDGSVGLE